MALSRRSARPRFTLLLLVLTAVTLLTVDQRGSGSAAVGTVKDAARDVMAPVQNFLGGVFSPVGNFIGGILHYGDLKAENERLREENDELLGRVAREDDAERELEVLLNQQDIEFATDIPRVGARVIQAAGSNFQQTVEISKGSSSGIAEGMPVVTGAGLVGRVTSVSRTRATVLLLTDRTSSVGIRLAESGEVGVATGVGGGRDLPVELVDPKVEVSRREIVVTSGLQGSVFPPGIPVGRVQEAEARPGELQQDVTIRPLVDVRRLTFVQVLQWSSNG